MSAVAAVAACAIVALGLWATSLRHDLSRRDALLAVLSDPGAQRVALHGASGTLVVSRGRRAALVAGLSRAPAGKTYELWVIRNGTPVRAGLFAGGGSTLLRRSVPRGATVAVTLERSGGVDRPTTKPILTASA